MMAPVIAARADAPRKLARSHQLVFDVLLARHANGHTDVTDSEIQEVLERLYAPRRFDRAWISGRVAEMKHAGILLESVAKRHDAHTQHIGAGKVRATYIPPGARGGVVGGQTGRVIGSCAGAVGECY